jgi:hypothetical protein
MTVQSKIQLLCFWKLYAILFLFKHNVLDTGFCFCLQVEPIRLAPVNRASPYLQTPAPAQDRVYKPSTAQIICES